MRPEDLIVVAWSGHGLSDGKGVFYLPPGKWLGYAVARVPELYAGLADGAFRAIGGARAADSTAKLRAASSTQRPALFDFNRRPSPLPFLSKVRP